MAPERGREAALVADRGGEPARVEQPSERVVHLDALADRLGERRRAVRHDHELLEVERVGRVPPAVDDVHERDRKERRPRAAEGAVERPAGGGGRRARRGERHGEQRVRPQARLVLRPIEPDQLRVERGLVGSVQAAQRGREHVVHVRHRAAHALAAVALPVAVAQLDRLVLPGGRAGGDGPGARRAAGHDHRRLHRGVAAGVEDLPGAHALDLRHCGILGRPATWCGRGCGARPPTPRRGAAGRESPARAGDPPPRPRRPARGG